MDNSVVIAGEKVSIRRPSGNGKNTIKIKFKKKQMKNMKVLK